MSALKNPSGGDNVKRVLARRAHRKRPEEMLAERRLVALATERIVRAHETGQRLIPLREVIERAAREQK